MHKDVSMLIMSVAGGGIDAGKLFGSRIACEEDRFYLLVRLALPGLFWKLLTLGSSKGMVSRTLQCQELSSALTWSKAPPPRHASAILGHRVWSAWEEVVP